MIFIIIASVTLLVSCSGKKKSNPTNPDFPLAGNADFAVIIDPDDNFLQVLSLRDRFFEATIRINDQNVPLQFDQEYFDFGLYIYYANRFFNYDTQYTISVTINDRVTEYVITTPTRLTGRFPSKINVNTPINVEWSLAKNAKYQRIDVWWYWDDWFRNDYWEKEIPATARSFVIPARTIPNNFDGVDIDVYAVNHGSKNKVFFGASVWDYAEYDSSGDIWNSSRSVNRKDRIHRVMSKIIELESNQ